MEKQIIIQIQDKIAVNKTPEIVVVNNNSDYTVFWQLDEEWNDTTIKTAVFCWNGKYTEVAFTGNVCEVPKIDDARTAVVGLFAGNLRTSTPALIKCRYSILTEAGDNPHPEPEEDVYQQLVDIINNIDETKADVSQLEAAITQEVISRNEAINNHHDSSKVDKVDGKELSSNDYTDQDKQKLSRVEDEAEVNVQSDWDVEDSTSDAFIKNKPGISIVNGEICISYEGD